jgi:hypothetical protein
LLRLVAEGKTIEMIVADLEKSKDAVYHKCRRLGLVVEEEGAKARTTSSIRLPKELPSVEEALKILAGVLQAASQAGLDKVEVQRLHAIATLARTYEQLVSRYIDYRGIVVMLIDMRKKYDALTGKMQRQPRQWCNDRNKSLEAQGGNG